MLLWPLQQLLSAQTNQMPSSTYPKVRPLWKSVALWAPVPSHPFLGSLGFSRLSRDSRLPHVSPHALLLCSSMPSSSPVLGQAWSHVCAGRETDIYRSIIAASEGLLSILSQVQLETGLGRVMCWVVIAEYPDRDDVVRAWWDVFRTANSNPPPYYVHAVTQLLV